MQLMEAKRSKTAGGMLAYLPPCLEPHLRGNGSASRKHLHSNKDSDVAKKGNNQSNTTIRAAQELFGRAEKWINGSEERKRKFSKFLPHITPADKAYLLQTLRAFHEACQQNNISYFMVEGSLLGAIRHHGLIPWDDDIDVSVDVQDLDRFQRALSCVPGYTLRVQSNMQWKFFPENANILNPSAKTRNSKTLATAKEREDYKPGWEHLDKVVMRYPFVDIFITTNSDGFTRALSQYIVEYVYFPTEDVYPLTVAPYDGYMAPVPRNSLELMKVRFDISLCVSNDHNYKLLKDVRGVARVPCKDLAEMYRIYVL